MKFEGGYLWGLNVNKSFCSLGHHAKQNFCYEKGTSKLIRENCPKRDFFSPFFAKEVWKSSSFSIKWWQTFTTNLLCTVTHKGCFNSLPVPNNIGAFTALTPLYCARECKARDPANKAVGLYYYTTCYCGPDAIGEESDFSGCGADCRGDKTQVCGNNLRQSVYNIESDTSTNRVLISWGHTCYVMLCYVIRNDIGEKWTVTINC